MCLREPNQAQKTLHLHSRVGEGWGSGGVSCGVSSFDNLTFSIGPADISWGAISLKDPVPEGREAKTRWHRTMGRMSA